MDSLNDMTLAQLDPEIQAVLDAELGRQRETLEMIASENFVPRAVLQAQGSVLTNKYAEGYPGRRYYGGCEFVDVAESLAIERAKQVFGGDYVNVQPHAGAQANAAALMAMANVGDTILGLSLAHGGHLTHGMRLNFSGKNYKAIAMKVAQTEEFKDRQRRTIEGAQILAERLGADDAKNAGIKLVTGGTDVHLVLVDLVDSELNGQQAEDLLHEVGITVNRNAVPFDPRPPAVTSGLRIGTPALASRGFDAEDFAEVADIIGTTLAQGASGANVEVDALRARVKKLTDKHPLYAGLEQ